jgi:enoyl-CoA hydratase/carnithine racemase
VNIKIPFTPVMTEIIRLLPDQQALRDLALIGKAVGGEEAKQMKVADSIHSEEELLPAAMAFAEMMAQKDRSTYRAIKHRLRADFTHTARERGFIRD